MDFIDAALPVPDYPERHFTNVAGDEFPLEYEPPQEVPDADDEDEYLLYMEWQSVHKSRQVSEQERIKARRNFLISNCVRVVSGPYELDGDDWVLEVEGGLYDYGYKVPRDPAGRRMAFILAKVVSSNADWNTIREHAIYAEISMDGIAVAMSGLGIKWDGMPILDVMSEKESSPLEYDTRLWEAEVAEAVGIPFDNRWYDIPIMAREMMVAAHLGRAWADSLLEEQAVQEARRGK